MTKTIFVTLGFTEWPVVSSLIKHGLNSGDRVITVIPAKGDARSQTAVHEIKAFLSKFASTVDFEMLQVDVLDFEHAVVQILKRLLRERKENRTVVVNLSGGMRVLILETYTALILSGLGNCSAEIVTEDKHELMIPRLWNMNNFDSLTDIDAKILAAVEEPKSVLSVAEIIKKPVSTTYRKVIALERMGLVITLKKGRMRVVSLTGLGKIIRTVFPTM